MRNRTKKRIQRKARAPITEPTIFGTGDEDEDEGPALDPESVPAGAELTTALCVDDEGGDVAI